MARRRSLLSQVARDSYLVSRAAGDAKAAERGPGAYAKRIVRRRLRRAIFQLIQPR